MSAYDKDAGEDRSKANARPDTLALFYQSVFTGIVRLQSGRQRVNDSGTLRRRIQDALKDVQKDAAAAGYRSREIRDTESAVVAFLDEAVLSLRDPSRDAWAKHTLSLELYGEANAGEVFFERLDELMGEADSPHLADVMEVYLLCLLLGFEGRFSAGRRAEAMLISERLKRRIEGMRREEYRLSPPLRFAEAAPPAAQPVRPENIWRMRLIGLVAAPFILFLLFKLHLSIGVDSLSSLLQAWR
jgi:type VI secretion system protein ImpK